MKIRLPNYFVEWIQSAFYQRTFLKFLLTFGIFPRIFKGQFELLEIKLVSGISNEFLDF